MLAPTTIPMLAQLEPQLPRGDRWAYEPKFDGFRGRLWRRGDASAQLFSRNGRDLAPWFPELTRAADILPRGTFLDGEIVIADEAGQADFSALQHRLTLARKFIRDAVIERPAILLVFDVLVLAEQDLAVLPYVERRRALQSMLDGLHPCLQLVAHTTDIQVAEGWLPSQDSRVSSPNGSIVRTCLVEGEIGSK